jgi:hypothetical protein
VKEEVIVDEAKVVKFGRKPAAGFDLMRELQVEGGLDAPEIEPGPRKKARRKRLRAEPQTGRLPRIEEPWSPMPLSRLTRPGLFPGHVRLWGVLIYRSRRGREPVELDAAVAAEAGIPVRRRSRYARQLEQLGEIRVEQHGQMQFTVTMTWKV